MAANGLANHLLTGYSCTWCPKIMLSVFVSANQPKYYSWTSILETENDLFHVQPCKKMCTVSKKRSEIQDLRCHWIFSRFQSILVGHNHNLMLPCLQHSYEKPRFSTPNLLYRLDSSGIDTAIKHAHTSRELKMKNEDGLNKKVFL